MNGTSDGVTVCFVSEWRQGRGELPSRLVISSRLVIWKDAKKPANSRYNIHKEIWGDGKDGNFSEEAVPYFYMGDYGMDVKGVFTDFIKRAAEERIPYEPHRLRKWEGAEEELIFQSEK